MTRFWIWLAWRLPRPLVYFAAERLIGEAACIHVVPNMNVLTPAQCLKTWLGIECRTPEPRGCMGPPHSEPGCTHASCRAYREMTGSTGPK